MRFFAYLSIALIVVSLQVFVSFALPKKNFHRHHHHEGHRRHEIKSKTPPTNETSMEKILTKISQNLGLGQRENSPSFPEIFDVQETAKFPDNVKTKTKTTTKVNGPFKTVTKVTQRFETDKHNKTHMIGQTVQSTTTSQNFTNNTIDAKRRPEIFSMDFNPFGFSMFSEEPERECHEKKPCKEKGTYCDQSAWECKPLVKPGKRCYQPGQCESGTNGNHECIWGTCTRIAIKTGDAGTFCKKDSDCASDNMRCAPQQDVSEFSDICIPKPGGDETCGRRRMFNFFSVRESQRSSPCKKGFVCVEVGNFGRKICRPESFLKNQEIKEDILV